MKSGTYLNRVVSCAVLCCTSLVSVGAIYEKAGFYAGLSAGAGYNTGNFIGNAPGSFIETTDKVSVCGFEKDFCGFIGCMTHLPRENWLAGLEFGIEKPFYKKHSAITIWNELDHIPQPENWQHRIKSIYTAKLHAKVGKILNENWFVYGLVGVDMKKTEISIRGEEIFENWKENKVLLGVAVGLGIEKEISENWRLGLECTNTYYPARTIKNIDNEPMFVVYKSRIKTNLTQISLRLIHNF